MHVYNSAINKIYGVYTKIVSIDNHAYTLDSVMLDRKMF